MTLTLYLAVSVVTIINEEIKMTTFTLTGVSNNKQVLPRIVAISDSFGDIENILIKNIKIISEDNYYPYFVIEEFEHNQLHPITKTELWYEWDELKGKLTKIHKPKMYSNIIGFGM